MDTKFKFDIVSVDFPLILHSHIFVHFYCTQEMCSRLVFRKGI